MIIGIGTDIIEISRIKEAIERSSLFIERNFNQNEVEYLRSRNYRSEHVAGRFAAKEAIAKALGTGFREFSLIDIEIDRTTLGKPIVVLKGKAKQIAQKLAKGPYKIHLSISHSKENAVAYAVIENESNKE